MKHMINLDVCKGICTMVIYGGCKRCGDLKVDSQSYNNQQMVPTKYCSF